MIPQFKVMMTKMKFHKDEAMTKAGLLRDFFVGERAGRKRLAPVPRLRYGYLPYQNGMGEGTDRTLLF